MLYYCVRHAYLHFICRYACLILITPANGIYPLLCLFIFLHNLSMFVYTSWLLIFLCILFKSHLTYVFDSTIIIIYGWFLYWIVSFFIYENPILLSVFAYLSFVSHLIFFLYHFFPFFFYFHFLFFVSIFSFCVLLFKPLLMIFSHPFCLLYFLASCSSSLISSTFQFVFFVWFFICF